MRNKTSKIWTTSKEELEKLLLIHHSLSGVLIELGLSNVGSSNYHRLKNRLSQEGIDWESITFATGKHPQSLKSLRRPDPIWSLNDILVQDSQYTNHQRLKIRLVEAKLLKKECYECGITEWKGQLLSLQLDHVNGKYNDNRIENLRLLCPNCHSLTKTFAGKNKKSVK